MAKSPKPFEIERGTDFVYKAKFVEKIGPGQFAPIDVSARTFDAVLKNDMSDLTPIAAFVVVMTEAALGFVYLTLNDATTSALEEGNFRARLNQEHNGIKQTLWTRVVAVSS